jgi:hypothetical protein
MRRRPTCSVLKSSNRVVLAGRPEESLHVILAGHEFRGIVVPTDVTREDSVRTNRRSEVGVVRPNEDRGKHGFLHEH